MPVTTDETEPIDDDQVFVYAVTDEERLIIQALLVNADSSSLSDNDKYTAKILASHFAPWTGQRMAQTLTAFGVTFTKLGV